MRNVRSPKEKIEVEHCEYQGVNTERQEGVSIHRLPHFVFTEGAERG